MKTPSEIKSVTPREVQLGSLYLLKLESKTFLAFAFNHQMHGNSFFLINNPKSDGNRIITRYDPSLQIYELCSTFKIQPSKNPSNIYIGTSNSHHTILVCAKILDSSGSTSSRYMFVSTFADRNDYIDIEAAVSAAVVDEDKNVNLQLWEIVDERGDVIYSYPPSSSGSASQN